MLYLHCCEVLANLLYLSTVSQLYFEIVVVLSLRKAVLSFSFVQLLHTVCSSSSKPVPLGVSSLTLPALFWEAQITIHGK